MNKKAISALLALATAGIVAASVTAASASPAPAPAGVHFDYAKGQLPENVVLEPEGTADLTFAAARQVAAVSPAGSVRILATMPLPADGGVHTPVLGFALTTGIDRASDGTLYFLYASGTADLTGVWRLRPGGTPHRIAALPAAGLPNGLALDARHGMLYLTDSVLGRIMRVPVAGGRATTWAAGPELAATGFLGANGLKLHDDALWASNLDQGTLLRLPLHPGPRDETVQVKATGLSGIDDFAFTGSGDEVLAARDAPNTVVRIRPGHPVTTVLDGADGLQNPTSVALRGNTLYVLSAAYTTATDPNLLLVRAPRRL
ncbi:hypothetical protein GCM10010172_18860 [Paractinoplanes ferrugineus]|uniref:Sugar lactone lactonase YvrE n=1 Tax=Paractinoplanes ferrugineus TaxID=113564 RepID=A0A919J8W5_9ACTN|nr:hypothetical protein [Actinoplanes ferrugineus]GIE16690.1 hypothetical protein Afe05nite_85300 [Actinoplanes ferrugineus]